MAELLARYARRNSAPLKSLLNEPDDSTTRETPLSIAVQKVNPELVTWLADNGATVAQKVKTRIPKLYASYSNSPSIQEKIAEIARTLNISVNSRA